MECGAKWKLSEKRRMLRANRQVKKTEFGNIRKKLQRQSELLCTLLHKRLSDSRLTFGTFCCRPPRGGREFKMDGGNVFEKAHRWPVREACSRRR